MGDVFLVWTGRETVAAVCSSAEAADAWIAAEPGAALSKPHWERKPLDPAPGEWVSYEDDRFSWDRASSADTGEEGDA